MASGEQIRNVFEEVRAEFDLSREELTSKKRDEYTIRAKTVLAKRLFAIGLSYAHIGRLMKIDGGGARYLIKKIKTL